MKCRVPDAVEASGSQAVRDLVDAVGSSVPHPFLDLQHTHPPIAGIIQQQLKTGTFSTKLPPGSESIHCFSHPSPRPQSGGNA